MLNKSIVSILKRNKHVAINKPYLPKSSTTTSRYINYETSIYFYERGFNDFHVFYVFYDFHVYFYIRERLKNRYELFF